MRRLVPYALLITLLTVTAAPAQPTGPVHQDGSAIYLHWGETALISVPTSVNQSPALLAINDDARRADLLPGQARLSLMDEGGMTVENASGPYFTFHAVIVDRPEGSHEVDLCPVLKPGGRALIPVRASVIEVKMFDFTSGASRGEC